MNVRVIALLIASTACADAPEPSAQEQATAAAAPAPAAPASQYIGLEHAVSMLPPEFSLPGGLELETIVFLDNPGFAGASPNNALTRVLGADGEMVWLEELVSRENATKAVWRVAGVLKLPTFDPNAQVVVISKNCTIGDRKEPNIVAIATPNQKTLPSLTNFSHAWRVNLPSRAFVEIGTKDLRCPIG